MKKSKVYVTMVLALFVFFSFLGSANAYISSHTWANPKRRNYNDSYYGWVNVAYVRGSTAKLIVVVQNNRGADYYYRARVLMDWASENVTSTAKFIKARQTEIIELDVPVPSDVSNIYLHTYRIYTEYSPTGTAPWYHDDVIGGSGFAVYSSVQSEAILFKQKLDAYPSWYPMPFLTSAKARELIINANILESLGNQAYETGNFNEARDYYYAALDNIQKAYAFDTQYLSSLESAIVGLMNSCQGYLSFQGYAFIIVSIGFLLMGIGVVVYLVRRSKPPQPTTHTE